MAYGVVIGGLLAEAIGDAFLLFSGGIAIGGFIGAATAWLRERLGAQRGSPFEAREPWWQRGPAIGTLVGGIGGAALAVIDAIVGG